MRLAVLSLDLARSRRDRGVVGPHHLARRRHRHHGRRAGRRLRHVAQHAHRPAHLDDQPVDERRLLGADPVHLLQLRARHHAPARAEGLAQRLQPPPRDARQLGEQVAHVGGAALAALALLIGRALDGALAPVILAAAAAAVRSVRLVVRRLLGQVGVEPAVGVRVLRRTRGAALRARGGATALALAVALVVAAARIVGVVGIVGIVVDGVGIRARRGRGRPVVVLVLLVLVLAELEEGGGGRTARRLDLLLDRRPPRLGRRAPRRLPLPLLAPVPISLVVVVVVVVVVDVGSGQRVVVVVVVVAAVVAAFVAAVVAAVAAPPLPPLYVRLVGR